MIISFVSQKGGVGKTTAAINLASSLARKNSRVLLVDADAQGSAVKWHGVEGNRSFEIVHQHAELHASDLRALSVSYDYVVIDAPPAVSDITRTIVAASNMVVIPVSPSSLDLWACKDTLQTIEEARQQRSNMEIRFLINRKIPGTRVGREIREALDEFTPETLDTELCQRVAYIDAMKFGVSVMQYAPGSKAAEEIEMLCDELVGGGAAGREFSDDMDMESDPIAELYRQETDNILFRSFQQIL